MPQRLTADRISIANLVTHPTPLTKFGLWLMDRVMGVRQMDLLYQQHQMQGLSKEAFSDKLIEVLELELCGIAQLQQRIPASGPVVIASNHPFGGIEGVVLARAICEVRPDLKVLANRGLGIFKELSDYFIFTNPLSVNDPQNAPSLRQCISHVDKGNALLLFPAGRVSHLNRENNQLVENDWNKVVAKLACRDNCQFVPVFVDGKNSSLFYKIERVYFKLRMFLLGRELLNKRGFKMQIATGNPVPANLFPDTNIANNSSLCRALSYAHDPSWHYDWPEDKAVAYKPLLSPIDKDILVNEIQALPQEQALVSFKTYQVYYGYQAQMPNVVTEIARLRELVFRQHNEGSGEPIDTDEFDATYTHLFIFDSAQKQIIGAYRMGQTDRLLAQQGLEGLYLHKMFDFSSQFINRQQPCLEMGRSFLIPEYQGSFQGLLLLWRGIGAFASKFPQYRTLYGTVSISKLYNPKSVKLIESVLINQDKEQGVKARTPFSFELHSEISAYLRKMNMTQTSTQEKSKLLSCFLKSIELDGKDVPILVKQYQKMGAEFHELGIDKSFNHTPGLLLSVNLAQAPTKLLKLYLGENYQAYVDYQ
ncbi:lysophospholipid acyltransferase family protein [Glaciecola sp. 1036]|uniref:lysophospholipid acyltransferase family protein n=1 Tax=Alteromonadaceae TaxID=72275 RepID=UPI003D063F31